MTKYIAIILVSAAIGAYLEYTFNPPKTETSVQIQDRIVTRTRIIKQPDGTVVTEIEKNEEIKKEIEKLVRDTQHQWAVSGGAGVGLDLKPYYSLGVERRVAGPVWVGLQATTKQELLVNLKLEL